MTNKAHWILAHVLMIFVVSILNAQNFDSGSTGVDGDLIFTIDNGPIQEFDHEANDHEGIWNFNNIVVPQGVTVTFPTTNGNATPPVIWLAKNDVQIHGI